MGQIPPIVGSVGVGPPVPGAMPPGPPQGPLIPSAGSAGAPYGMYPFYGQPPYMMGGGQDPLTGKPLAAGPPPQGQQGAPQAVGGPPQSGGGPGQPPVNLCDYKGAKEPPPLDLMTKPPSDLNVSGPQQQPPGASQPPQQLMGQGPPPSGPLAPSSAGSVEATSPLKEYPGGMSAAALAAQQHQQQQAKVLSHYYPYK